jgi:hypothetical protein
MERELVERARRGDHDAFATLAGAAISPVAISAQGSQLVAWATSPHGTSS